MIGFMPELYPDELVYSWLARYHVRSGHGNFKQTKKETLNTDISKRISMEYLNAYTDDFYNIINKYDSIEDIITNHTMFNVYTKFFSSVEKKMIIENLLHHKKIIRLKKYSKQDNSTIKYCPLCAKEDRKKYGETYWHILWLIDGVNTCPIHKCSMNSTNILSYGSYRKVERFEIAEHVLPYDDTINYSVDENQLRFVEYVYSVLYEDTLESNESLKDFLNGKISQTKYVDSKKKQRHRHDLCKDIISFCKINNLPILKESEYNNVFYRNRYPYYLAVCIVGYFLNIEPSLLVNRNKKLSKSFVDKKKIDDIINLSKLDMDYINDEDIPYILSLCNNNKDNEALHITTSNILFYKIKKLYKDKDVKNLKRRITTNTLRHYYKIDAKNLSQFPNVLKYIDDHLLSWDEMRAIRIVDSYTQLENKNSKINYNNVARLAGVNRIRFEKALPYLENYTDKETVNKIRAL